MNEAYVAFLGVTAARGRERRRVQDKKPISRRQKRRRLGRSRQSDIAAFRLVLVGLRRTMPIQPEDRTKVRNEYESSEEDTYDHEVEGKQDKTFSPVGLRIIRNAIRNKGISKRKIMAA